MSLRCIVNLFQILSFIICNFVKLFIGAKMIEFSLIILSWHSYPLCFIGFLNGVAIVYLALYGLWCFTLTNSTRLNYFKKCLFVVHIATIMLLSYLYYANGNMTATVRTVYRRIFNGMNDTMRNVKIVGEVQSLFDCCGVTDASDFYKLSHFWLKIKNTLGADVPMLHNCSIDSIRDNIGCVGPVEEFLRASINSLSFSLSMIDIALGLIAHLNCLAIEIKSAKKPFIINNEEETQEAPQEMREITLMPNEY